MPPPPRTRRAAPPAPGTVFSGDALKHNLIKELIATNTISSKDLELIDRDDAATGA